MYVYTAELVTGAGVNDPYIMHYMTNAKSANSFCERDYTFGNFAPNVVQENEFI